MSGVNDGIPNWGLMFGDLAPTMLQALHTSHLALVELPAPDVKGEYHAWGEQDVMARPGSGVVRVYLGDSRMTSDDARQMAAELLAAADVADKRPQTP